MKQDRNLHCTTHALAAELFGDYELIVDTALAGDQKLKQRIAEADARNRGGLAVLKNALRNRQVTLPPSLTDILRICEADQQYYDELQNDLDYIDVHGSSYRVRLAVGGERITKRFDNLRAAQVWRDRLLILRSQDHEAVECFNLGGQ
jgi:hypothetical protein